MSDAAFYSMKLVLHHLTLAQFTRAIMRETRHQRKMKRGRSFTQDDLVDVTGYNLLHVNQWEQGLRRPSLFQALVCLQAVRCA